MSTLQPPSSHSSSVQDFLFQNSSVIQPEPVEWSFYSGNDLKVSVENGSFDIDSLVFCATSYELLNHPALRRQLSTLPCKVFK